PRARPHRPRRRHPRGPAVEEDDRAPPRRSALRVHRRRRRLRRSPGPRPRRGPGRPAGRQDHRERRDRRVRRRADAGRRRRGRGEDEGVAGGAASSARLSMQTLQIFLSHSTGDRVIAEALKKLLEDLFGKNRVRIDFSSDQEAGGGIAPGANWLTWITDKITQDDRTYVLLTPSSMRKPWVLWESGAAAGVALATKRPAPSMTPADQPSPVVPIT